MPIHCGYCWDIDAQVWINCIESNSLIWVGIQEWVLENIDQRVKKALTTSFMINTTKCILLLKLVIIKIDMFNYSSHKPLRAHSYLTFRILCTLKVMTFSGRASAVLSPAVRRGNKVTGSKIAMHFAWSSAQMTNNRKKSSKDFSINQFERETEFNVVDIS